MLKAKRQRYFNAARDVQLVGAGAGAGAEAGANKRWRIQVQEERAVLPLVSLDN